MRPLRQQGFTLLELLVVMVIIGLLVGYVAPNYFAQLDKSEVKAARAQMSSIAKALEVYRLDTSHFPSQEAGLNAINIAPADEPKWKGPYLQKDVPPDPWGQSYVYRIPGEKRDYDLFSYGKDGKPGGTDDNADIYN